jgi:serine/threonine protein kinase/TolB-like protein
MLHSSDRWKQIEALFHESLDVAPASRGAFLDERCGDDPELKKEVQTLLESAGETMDFLQQPVLNAAQDLVARGTAAPISPGTEIDHYQIISLVGAGGMGQVYLAEDTRLKRKVAIKMLSGSRIHDESGLRRFEREARAASALNHPNILTIYEFGQADGLCFIVSEYLEGKTLRQELADGSLEIEKAVDIAVQIAKALDAANSSGIVHRDIKPENVIIRADGLVKVLDFGIAKLSEADTQPIPHRPSRALAVTVSQVGQVIGSARYMSPEQARGQLVDARSDIFSLGVVMYEMIAGRAPFDGDTVSDVIAEVLKGTPPALDTLVTDVPEELQAIIQKALSKDRESRYQSVKEMLAQLQDFQREAEFRAKFKTGSGRKGKPAGRGSDAGERTTARIAGAVGAPEPFSRAKRIGFPILFLLLIVLGIGYARWLYKNHATTAGARPRSLAILPFRNLRQDPAVDYLGFSLSDAVISKLGYISTLVVRPSSSVDKYRNQSVDPQKIGEELHVDTLLTGSFLKDGDDLRIMAQLIDLKANRILWRDSIDVKYDKLLTVQDRVSQEIVKGLELNLSSSEAQRLKPEKPIDPVAYENYLRGVDFYSSNDFVASAGMLEKSVAIEPDYAPAWAHLGRAYETTASLQLGGREEYDKAQAAYEKALALNPEMVEARVYMANLLTDTGKVEQAVPLLRAALQDGPNNAEVHWELGYAYRFAGMLQESVEEGERARQNNPEVKINSSAMNGYLYLGQYDKFLRTLPANNSAYVLFYRGFAEYYLNQKAEAARDFEGAYTLDPSLLPAKIGKVLNDSMQGRRAAGLQLLRETEREMEERGVGDAEGMYKVSQAYAVLGDTTASLHMLMHTIEGGFFCSPCFETDPLLESIRKEPEFQRLVGEARERHEQFKARFF